MVHVPFINKITDEALPSQVKKFEEGNPGRQRQPKAIAACPPGPQEKGDQDDGSQAGNNLCETGGSQTFAESRKRRCAVIGDIHFF